jgi:hypothetical protein
MTLLPLRRKACCLFGTVVRCKPSSGAYDVGIMLSRPLEMLRELCCLNESLLIESLPHRLDDFPIGF